MKRTVVLTEQDLHNIVRQVISETFSKGSLNDRLKSAMGDKWDDSMKNLSLKAKKRHIRNAIPEEERIAKEQKEWERFKNRLKSGKLDHLFVLGCGPHCGLRNDVEKVIQTTVGQFRHVDDDVEQQLRSRAEIALKRQRSSKKSLDRPNRDIEPYQEEESYWDFIRDICGD